ncbi:MAG TPA: Asp-tRNA(Asn)/Glu-tRNA(Gln) amidotransferase subunit GatC [Candidatus Brachybacterium merdigallinarum]|nr:Asp-tRNA(Asn)/Glu-tRNA(Gln) amidotransferase subunit GatC [Candidatus Brachybacterium merdigallinarum]
MPSIGRDDVTHLADLARIQLTDEEVDRLAGEFDAIMDAVASVSEVASEDVPATSHPIAMTNVFREDVVSDTTLTQEQALDQAPDAQDGRFAVPQILGEE